MRLEWQLKRRNSATFSVPSSSETASFGQHHFQRNWPPDWRTQPAASHLSQQFEHFCRLLRLLLPQKPLDLPDPRHASHIRAVVGPPQHPWKLVGPEHQGGEQQVPAALLALWRALILRASSPGQFAFEIETSLPAQLGTHHSRGGRVCGGGGGGGGGSGGGDGAFTTCCQDITLNLQRAQPKLSPVRKLFQSNFSRPASLRACAPPSCARSRPRTA